MKIITETYERKIDIDKIEKDLKHKKQALKERKNIPDKQKIKEWDEVNLADLDRGIKKLEKKLKKYGN